MNSEVRMCAPSNVEGTPWHEIDWSRCHQNVRRLQARIVKAQQEGRHNKVKALSWLLTHSFSGKAIAVKRVTENQGKKTPGVDGKTWSTPEEKSQAILSLRRRGYKPQPLKRTYVPKKNGKKRPLGIPVMKDRAMQALYLLPLQPIAECTGDGNSYGFRPKRATRDAIEQCFIRLARKSSPQWILEGDIKGCFDNISHDWLIQNVPMDKKILQQWLKAGFMEKQIFYRTVMGTPQGGIISPTLANMALDGLQGALDKRFPKITRQGHTDKVGMVRYADDFIITGSSKELLEKEVKPLAIDFLKARGLELSQEKTRITHINEGFDFLGQNVRKYKDKLLIKPSKANVKTFLTKVRETIEDNKTAKQSNLIKQLNPKIRGWVNYHKHVVAKKTFNTVDKEIWKKIWQWAKRRHPNKGNRWIKSRYFKKVGTRDWVFTTDEDGMTYTLIKASDTPIRRHVKIKAEANSFDPEWEEYFEVRAFREVTKTQKGRGLWSRLWLNQKGKCPICHQEITMEGGWHIHHRLQQSDGGEDNITNLMMLHPNCHRQLHNNLRLKSKYVLVSETTLIKA